MRRSIVAVALSLALAACGEAKATGSRPAVRADAATDAQRTAVATGVGDAGFRLLRELDDGNIVFSPFSVSLALGMGYAGARGTTAEQMADAMAFPAPPAQLGTQLGGLWADVLTRTEDGDDELLIANSLWPSKDGSVLEAFSSAIERDYGATVHAVDYADAADAADQINGWVEDATKSRIRDLVEASSFAPLTKLTIVNAVYLKAKWAEQFEKDATRDRPFHADGAEAVTRPFMHRQGTMWFAAGDGYRAVALPYKSDLMLVAILPDEGRRADVEAALDGLSFATLLRSLETGETTVDLALPKFEQRTNARLVTPLTAMGMPVAFDESLADFSGISRLRLVIDDVVHQAWVLVDEEGTEAAAATAVEFRAVGAPIMQQQLVFDRPFLFAVVDRPTGTPLFLGRVADPRPPE